MVIVIGLLTFAVAFFLLRRNGGVLRHVIAVALAATVMPFLAAASFELLNPDRHRYSSRAVWQAQQLGHGIVRSSHRARPARGDSRGDVHPPQEPTGAHCGALGRGLMKRRHRGTHQSTTSAPIAIIASTELASTSAAHGMTLTEGVGGGGPG